MNYLAHIFLSGANPDIQIGNFIGDAVKGNAYLHYPLAMQQGILLHRRIDAFSDTHPLVKEAVHLVKEVGGRYAAVVTDIFFDHFLAVDFRLYATCSLGSFARRFYMALLLRYRYLPPRIQGFLWHFVMTNRLGCYASVKGIQRSLEIMTTYRNLGIQPEETIDFLMRHYEELQTLFRAFFPALQVMCQAEVARITTTMLNS